MWWSLKSVWREEQALPRWSKGVGVERLLLPFAEAYPPQGYDPVALFTSLPLGGAAK